MSYCSTCESHETTFTKVKDGFHCSGCDEIHYFDEMDRESALRTYKAILSAIADGWKIYPNIEGLGDPIDLAFEEAKKECERLQVKIQ